MSVRYLPLRARGKRRGFGPGASCALQGSDQSFHYIFWGVSLFFEIGHLPLHFCDIECSEVRSQIEETSDLKIAGKSIGKKGSLKSRREKIVYIHLLGLWSNPYGARPPLAARPNGGIRPVRGRPECDFSIVGRSAKCARLP